jgi:preprotein translocase subunit YajC
MEYLATLVTVGAAQQGSTQNPSMFILMIATIAFAFYFIIIRPQKREQQQRKMMLESVKKGDKVVTVGGIHGVVVDVDENASVVTIEVAKNVRMSFSKSAVSTITKKKGGEEKEATQPASKEKKTQSSGA